MTFQTLWYKTCLPSNVINSFLEDTKLFENHLEQAALKDNVIRPSSRSGEIYWVTNRHWIAGFCYHYILEANKTNFNYDINGFDNNTLQYTSYSVGDHYKWHIDTINDKPLDQIRKLSFTVQLSDPEEYSGGELQFLGDDDQLYFAPKDKGTIIIFDSRIKHRVRKVNSGCRKALVGWVEGPKWK